MPVVKTYLKYAATGHFGGVASNGGASVYVSEDKIASAALEDIFIWDTRRGDKSMTLAGEPAWGTVSALARSTDARILAAGYSTGEIRIWDVPSATVTCVLAGHRSQITTLSFDATASRLVSGAVDTDIIVWDVVNQAGLYRLRGHKNPITQCAFLLHHNFLVSSSKDTFVKFWDLDTQHCVYTLVGHRSEVTCFALARSDQYLVTGTTDTDVRIWKIEFRGVEGAAASAEGAAAEAQSDFHFPAFQAPEDDAAASKEEGDAAINPIKCHLVGTVARQSRERAEQLIFSQNEKILLCQGAEKAVEVFRIRSDDEVEKKLARRQKRQREKKKGKQPQGESAEQEAEGSDGEADADGEVSEKIDDRIVHVHIIRPSAKVVSTDLITPRRSKDPFQVAVHLTNNSIETYSLSVGKKEVESSKVATIAMEGHRGPVRSVALSSDETLILSTSNSTAKIWNRANMRCIRTLEADYGLCCAFVPGNRHVLIGTKTGHIQLFDVASGEMLENIEAHTKSIWSLVISPDKQGFVTGSADHDIKFWEFELVSDEKGRGKRLSCVHTRTLKMADEVTCVTFSPNQKLLAVALLDTTIKIFYADTLKFFLSLYGHKLPVLSLDISADSTLLISGSADKNVKLWGLDFGDCHKSFFAHQDSITAVKFSGTSHYFFTVSKDKTVKEWDGDNFEKIANIGEHHDQISGATISEKGNLLVTCSHDHSIRLWERTREMLNPEEEAEFERERAYDEAQAEADARVDRAQRGDTEASSAGKKSAETVKAAEQLMEAIELAEADAQRGPGDPVNPLITAFRAKNGSDYLRIVMDKVKSSELEEALLVMPFDFSVLRFTKFIADWALDGLSLERSVRCLFYLLRVHHNQIVSNHRLVEELSRLRDIVQRKLREYKDLIGGNLAALSYLQRELELKNVHVLEDVEEMLEDVKRKKRKLIK